MSSRLATGTVPKHLRDASYKGAARLGHGKGYVYPHNEPGGWVAQQYRPVHLEGRTYWEPTGRGQDQRREAGTGDADGREADSQVGIGSPERVCKYAVGR